MIHEYSYADMTWWWFTRRFRDEAGAKRAFEKLDALGRKYHGKLDLGIYRHGPSNKGPIFITVLSHKERGVALAAGKIFGTPELLEPRELEPLILRRARMLKELSDQNAPAGSYAIKRGRAAILLPDGTMEEQIGEG